jgi:hypothetical protein
MRGKMNEKTRERFKPVYIDDSIKPGIFWLFSHQYYTEYSCSGLLKEHTKDDDISPPYILFVLDYIPSKQVYILLKTLFQLHEKEIINYTHLTLHNDEGSRELTLSYYIAPDWILSEVYNTKYDTPKGQEIIENASRTFFQKLKENHAAGVSQKEIRSPQWAYLSPEMKNLANYFYHYIYEYLSLFWKETPGTKPFSSPLLISSYNLRKTTSTCLMGFFREFMKKNRDYIQQFLAYPSNSEDVSKFLSLWRLKKPIPLYLIIRIFASAQFLFNSFQNPLLIVLRYSLASNLEKLKSSPFTDLVLTFCLNANIDIGRKEVEYSFVKKEDLSRAEKNILKTMQASHYPGVNRFLERRERLVNKS